ncbi:MAG: peptide ABC transporter substrate-binding protein [Anaerolineales bacterium]|nr:peptide ABC transporter substrate-binding protein [Anaerolineales bacterium]
MKRLRWQILVVAATLVVSALLLLSQQPINVVILPQAATGGVYTEALIGSMGRLNPALDWNNPADRDLDRLLFNGLIKFDSRGLPQPDLADSWAASEDGKIYNFTLRKNAVWHDGQPVVSDDVLYTIEIIKSSASLFPQDVKDLWSQIQVKRLDDKNFQFVLPEPFSPFLDYATFGILPKHILESVPVDQFESAEFNLKPIGTGPYQFDRLIISGGQIAGVALTANPKYFDGAPYIEQVVFRYYPDSETALTAYQKGGVMGISHIMQDALEKALLEPRLSVYTSRLPQMGLVFLNLNNPDVSFLQNAKVRRALMLGLNRSVIVSHILKGQAIVADSPILPGSWAYFDDVEKIEYNPEAAAQILNKEGYIFTAGSATRSKDGQALSFSLVYPDDAIHAQIAQAVQSDWALIGVQVNLQAVPYNSLLSDYLAPRTYQAALADLNTSRSPDPDPYPFWHQAEATGGQNYSGWDDRAASEFLESARTIADFSERVRLYRNFQVIFAKELPSLPLYYPVYSFGVDSQVQGVQTAPLYDTSDRLARINQWYLVTRRALEGQPTAEPTAIP